MAKVIGFTQSPRAPSFRGAFVIRPGRTGQVAVGWPKPRGKRLTPRQKEAVEKFREAAWIAKAAPAEDQLTSRKLAHGSQFLPRDLQYMAIYGRLCTLFFTNGERRYQLASRFDLTELLDILGYEPGSMLVRTAEFWETVPPGEAGQVLTSQGPNVLPIWTQGGGGSGLGGWGQASIAGAPAAQGSNGATKGQIIQPLRNLSIAAIRGAAGGAGGTGDMQGVVARMIPNGSDWEVAEVIAKTPVIPAINNTMQPYRWEFGEVHELNAGDIYLIGITRTDVSGTGVCRIGSIAAASGFVSINGPLNTLATSVIIPSSDLQTGDVSSNTFTLGFAAWAEGGILD